MCLRLVASAAGRYPVSAALQPLGAASATRASVHHRLKPRHSWCAPLAVDRRMLERTRRVDASAFNAQVGGTTGARKRDLSAPAL